MTYGSTLNWRIKPAFKTVFITLCVVLSVALILFTYNSTSPVRLENTDAQTYVVRNEQFGYAIVQNENALIQDRVENIQEISVEKLEINEELKHVKTSSKYQDIQIDEPVPLVQESADDDGDQYDDSKEYSEEVVSEPPKLVNISSDRGGSQLAGFQWNDTRLDILHMRKPEYDPMFKNPCWHELLKTPTPYENNIYATFSPSAKRVLGRLTELWEDVFTDDEPTYRLRCLPYFMVIGQPKCGTTDLFWKIAKHPDILTPPIKELHWWSRSRQGRRFSYSKIIPFEDYIDMFDEPAITIEQHLHNITELDDEDDSMYESEEQDEVTKDDTQPISGEASVSLFWDNEEWMKYPENSARSEPAYIVPHYIHHIMPDVKLILMLRDPVERMYSDYLYFHSNNKSADDFHSAVVSAVDLYTKCIATYSVRRCIYDTSLAHRVRVRLRIGMYSAYMKDWLKLFPLSQFYMLRLEDYSRNPVQLIEEIYEFLQMRPLSIKEQETIEVSPVSNVRKDEDKELGGMLEKTRQILTKFYDPYNKELSELLKDKKYLWTNV